MAKYATNQSFGGQRASLKRAVVVAQEELEDGGGGVAKWTGNTSIVAGEVGEIHGPTDLPVIYACNGEIYHPEEQSLEFVATSTEAEVEALKPGQWTWPVRI